MATHHSSTEDLLAEIAALRNRLEEAENTLRAIREGEEGAMVVCRPGGEQIYTLKDADYSYRMLTWFCQEPGRRKSRSGRGADAVRLIPSCRHKGYP